MALLFDPLSSLKTIWIHSSGPKIEICSKHVDLMKEAKILLTSLLKILKQFFRINSFQNMVLNSNKKEC